MASILRGSSLIGGMDLWGWEFEPDTMSLDCSTASKERMIAALSDCYNCEAVEYPETQAGTERATERAKMLESWIEARWPDEAKDIIWKQARVEANRLSRIHYPHAYSR